MVKTSSKTSRDDLSKFKQGNATIVDYNSIFTFLASYVVQSDEDAIIKYVAGLNPEVQYAAIHVPGWRDAIMVAEKQAIAIQGQRIVDEVTAMGGKAKKQVIYQHPNPINPVPIPVQITKPLTPLQNNHQPMEVDAITARNEKRNPFPEIRSICIQKGLCFRCLQPFKVKTHMVGGEHHCPNRNASLSDKLALISTNKQDKKVITDIKTHQIVALSIGSDTEEQDTAALESLRDEGRDAVGWMVEEYLTGWSDINYPTESERVDQVEVNAIRLMADDSYPRRVVVPFKLKDTEICVPTMAFLDIGSMTNFVDDRFAKEHQLKLSKNSIPMKTEAYNGEAGLDVVWDWNGKLEGVGVDGRTESFDICLNVTRSGKHKVMMGLPWMQRVGCFLKLIQGGSYLVLGKTMLVLAVVLEQTKTTTLDCERNSPINSFSLPSSPPRALDMIPSSINAIGKNLSENLSPFQIMISRNDSSPPLVRICQEYLDVFSPQESVLPPHCSFDIAIDEGCEAPFGGLSNLALNEQVELKKYLNDLLRKGFIRPSKSAAAAPIFFVKVPGKNNRPCVDYRGLNKVSKRDSYPIPFMSWLLNQLKGCNCFAKIDLKSAFNLFRVAKGDEWKPDF